MQEHAEGDAPLQRVELVVAKSTPVARRSTSTPRSMPGSPRGGRASPPGASHGGRLMRLISRAISAAGDTRSMQPAATALRGILAGPIRLCCGWRGTALAPLHLHRRSRSVRPRAGRRRRARWLLNGLRNNSFERNSPVFLGNRFSHHWLSRRPIRLQRSRRDGGEHRLDPGGCGHRSIHRSPGAGPATAFALRGALAGDLVGLGHARFVGAWPADHGGRGSLALRSDAHR